MSRCHSIFWFGFAFWATFAFVFELSGCYFCFKFMSLFLSLILFSTNFEALFFKFVFGLGPIKLLLHRLIGPCYFLMGLYKLLFLRLWLIL